MILNFVVSGNECVVHAHPSDTLREIVDIAFTCTRYRRKYGFGSPHDGDDMPWEVRDNDGRLLDESVAVHTLAYTAGTDKRIYVSLRAGVGG